MIKKIPNILTIFRLFLVPVFIWAYFESSVWGGIVFVIACVTDVIDGIIARKFNAITKFGILIDPLADKMMQMSAVICLFISGILPQWIVTVIVAKELIMIVCASLLFKKDIIIPSNKVGKGATVFLSVMVVYFMLFGSTGNLTNDIISTLLGIVAFLVLLSYLMLMIKNLTKKKEEASAPSNDV